MPVLRVCLWLSAAVSPSPAEVRIVGAPPGVLAEEDAPQERGDGPRRPAKRRAAGAAGAGGPRHPDLAGVRYRDPERAREIWLGLAVGGVALPARFTGIGRGAWAQRTTGAWALALGRRVAAGGQHDLVWYAAGDSRLQVNEHRLSLSGAPATAPGRKLRDRLAVGVELHVAKRNWVQGRLFKLGGLWDTVVYAGYGMEHRLPRRLRLGWNVQGRYVWVFNSTQRQARASLRLALRPRPAHQISLEGVGFVIHRDADQFGNPLPRLSVAAQVNLDYQWMSAAGWGTFVRLHYASSFMSGTAPVFEVREEALGAHYGEVMAGLRVLM